MISLFQANLPPGYWVEALNMAAHLFSLLPSTAIKNEIPFTKLFHKPVSYDHLRVFGCLCYPNLTSTAKHKFSPRSTACVFLGFSTSHKGYRCLDLITRKVILSRHVIFDENIFHFSTNKPSSFETESHDISPPLSSPLLREIISPPPIPNTTQPPPPNNPPAVPPTTHPMVTRSKRGISKPRQPLSLTAQAISSLPTSYLQALEDPHWRDSMHEEYDAQIKKGTWSLVPRPNNVNVVRLMWIHRYKYDSEGNLVRHKSRMVANG